MLTQSESQEIKTLLQDIHKFSDFELIIRQDTWGPINFESAKPDIELVLSITSALLSMPLEFLTQNIANSLKGRIPAVSQWLNEIDSFSIESGDASARRDNICNELHVQAESFQSEVMLAIPYLAWHAGDFSELAKMLDEAVQNVRSKLDESEKYFDKQKEAIDEIVEATRQAASTTGVSTFTNEFGKEVTELTKQSFWWLKATIASSVLTLGAAITFFFWPVFTDEASAWSTIRIVASKATVIAVLFTGTVWCGRIFRALKHQATIYRHRELGLRTFQAFVKATDDSNVRDAILLTTTKAIFSHVPTGLINQPTNEGRGTSFVEIGKSVASRVPSADIE